MECCEALMWEIAIFGFGFMLLKLYQLFGIPKSLRRHNSNNKHDK